MKRLTKCYSEVDKLVTRQVPKELNFLNYWASFLVYAVTFVTTVLAALLIPMVIGPVSQGESFAKTVPGAAGLQIISLPGLSTMLTWRAFLFSGGV